MSKVLMYFHLIACQHKATSSTAQELKPGRNIPPIPIDKICFTDNFNSSTKHSERLTNANKGSRPSLLKPSSLMRSCRMVLSVGLKDCQC
jgi:hypothetical protein